MSIGDNIPLTITYLFYILLKNLKILTYLHESEIT